MQYERSLSLEHIPYSNRTSQIKVRIFFMTNSSLTLAKLPILQTISRLTRTAKMVNLTG